MPVLSRSVLALAFVPVLAGLSWADSVRVSAYTANLRAEPTVNAAVVTTLKRGDVLEVVEKAGAWYRVKTSAGLAGYVSARLVELSTEPVAAAPPAPPASAAPAAPVAAVTPPGDVTIDHNDVGCVVAGRHPRFSACLAPVENVGRARVVFRARAESPWFSVELRPDGACHSALLPKPRATITSFQYFIEVVDRSFTSVQRPEAAPDRSYTPRVVESESACERGRLVAAGVPSGSVFVNLARDASGRILQAAAATPAAGTAPGALSSAFSLDGVTLGSPGAASTATASSTTSKASNPAGKSATKPLLIGAGVAAEGVLVAVVAGGGGGGGSASGNKATAGGSGGTGGTSPGASPAGPTVGGHWSGTAANGGGITSVFSGPGVSCTGHSDLTMDLIQSSSGAFTGTGSTTTPTVSCNVPVPASPITSVGSGTVNGNLTGSTVTFIGGSFTFTGTLNGSVMEGTATSPDVQGLVSYTWKVVR